MSAGDTESVLGLASKLISFAESKLTYMREMFCDWCTCLTEKCHKEYIRVKVCLKIVLRNGSKYLKINNSVMTFRDI